MILLLFRFYFVTAFLFFDNNPDEWCSFLPERYQVATAVVMVTDAKHARKAQKQKPAKVAPAAVMSAAPVAPGARTTYTRDELNRLARENPYLTFNVGQIRLLFDLPEVVMTRLRKLAQKDRKTDPWINDKTRPEKFQEWLWGRRIDLEIEHPDV